MDHLGLALHIVETTEQLEKLVAMWASMARPLDGSTPAGPSRGGEPSAEAADQGASPSQRAGGSRRGRAKLPCAAEAQAQAVREKR